MGFPTNARIASVLGAAIIIIGCVSQPGGEISTPSAGPALWSVSDENATVYIFGVLEAVPSETAWRSPAFERAYEAADIVILETDTRPETQAEIIETVQSIGVFKDGGALRDVLSEEQSAAVAKAAETLGIPIEALDPLRPWLAAAQLGSVNAVRRGYDNWEPLMTSITVDAKEDGKAVRFLETSRAALLKRIDTLPETTHGRMAAHAAREIVDNPDQAEDIIPFWLAGDLEAMAVRFHGPGRWADDAIYEALVTTRNRAWADDIAATMRDKEGVALYVVGMGHLVGDDALQIFLEANGARVRRR